MAAARETLNLDSRLGGPLPPPQQAPVQQQNGNSTPFSGNGAVPTPPLPPTSNGLSSPRHHQDGAPNLKPVLSPLSLHPPLAGPQQNGIKPSNSPISASTRPSLSAILLPPPNGIKTESPNGTTPVSAGANGANGARSPLGSPNGLGPNGLTNGHPVPIGHGLAAAPDNKAYEALKALNRNLCT